MCANKAHCRGRAGAVSPKMTVMAYTHIPSLPVAGEEPRRDAREVCWPAHLDAQAERRVQVGGPCPSNVRSGRRSRQGRTLHGGIIGSGS